MYVNFLSVQLIRFHSSNTISIQISGSVPTLHRCVKKKLIFFTLRGSFHFRLFVLSLDIADNLMLFLDEYDFWKKKSEKRNVDINSCVLIFFSIVCRECLSYYHAFLL